MSAAGKVEKGKFSVINTNPRIMKVYKIAGLDSVLNVSKARLSLPSQKYPESGDKDLAGILEKGAKKPLFRF